jgi:PAS domain S-box-containing protein
MPKYLKRKIDVVFLTLLFILLAVFFITFKRLQFTRKSERMVSHTHQVLHNLERIHVNTVEIETGQRGFIITGKEEYLQPLTVSLKKIEPELAKLKSLIADNPTQLKRLATLTHLLRSRLEILQDGISLRKEKGLEDALDFIKSNKGKMVMDEIRSVISDMKDEEITLLESRSVEISNSSQTSNLLYFLLSGFVTATILVFYFYIRKGTLKLNAVNNQLAVKNNELLAVNEEMQSTEEQLMANLDQINLLQKFLEDRERQYRELFENASDIIYELDENGRLELFNPSLENISGFSAEELKNKVYLELVHPNYRERAVAFYQQQLKSRKVTSYLEFPMATKHKKPVWIGQNVRMVFNDEGWALKVVVVARNISDLKTIQRKLKRSEKQYRLISENSHDFIALNKPSGEYVFVSNAAKDLLGYDPDELIGRTDLEFIHSDDVPGVRDLYSKVLQGESVLNVQYRMRKKDGAYIWVETNAKPIFHANGVLTDIQTSSRNITYRKKVEEELIKAKEAAEELTKAKSLFLSMMSHEIRTPMNAIIGLTNILMQESPRDDQYESLKLLKFSGDNLLTIINDILDFSKIEAGKIELENIDFNLFELISNIKLMLQQRAIDKGIDLLVNFDKSIPRIVNGDQVRIGQIVTNLVSNAIKFTDRGCVELFVEQLGVSNDKVSIRFKSKDTGIGIEEDKVKLIFESFSQARTDTTRKFGGTGLGLSISKRLLNLMGSEIEVVSKYGEGSEFFFTLILEKGKTNVSESTLTKNVTRDFKDRNIKVLLVDDNRVNQVVANNFLKKWGIAADITDNGKSAIDMIQNKSYQLVLMDLQMPGMDGYEATKAIRSMKDSYFKNIPIIALTAEAMMEIKQQAFAAGMNDFITKPFQPDELQSIIFQHTNLEVKPDNKFNYISKINLYAEGDPEFRRELASLIVKNLEELREAVQISLTDHSSDIYQTTFHKVKATINMLGDTQLTACIENLNEKLSHMQSGSSGADEVIERFKFLSEEVISGLREENLTV